MIPSHSYCWTYPVAFRPLADTHAVSSRTSYARKFGACEPIHPTAPERVTVINRRGPSTVPMEVNSRPYADTHACAVLWRWRQRISWRRGGSR